VLRFKIRPRFNKPKTLSSELHQFIGVWSPFFNLITTLTGTIILLIILVSEAQKLDKPKPVPKLSAVEKSLDQIMEKARKTLYGIRSILYAYVWKKKMILYSMTAWISIFPSIINFQITCAPSPNEKKSNSFFIKNQPF